MKIRTTCICHNKDSLIIIIITILNLNLKMNQSKSSFSNLIQINFS